MTILKALAAGLTVGIVVIEGLCAAVAAFTPFPPPCPLRVPIETMPVPAMVLVWLAGSAAAGAMATGIAGRGTTGWIAGALLCLPLAVTAALSGPTNSASAALIMLPLFGAGAGATLAGRLLADDLRATESGSEL